MKNLRFKTTLMALIIVVMTISSCTTNQQVVSNKRFQKRKLQSGYFLNFGKENAKEMNKAETLDPNEHIRLVHEVSTSIVDDEILLDTIPLTSNDHYENLISTNIIKRLDKEFLEVNKIRTVTKSVLEIRNRTEERLIKSMQPKKTQDELEWAIFFAILMVLFGIGWGLFVKAGNVLWSNVFLVFTIACLTLALANILAAGFIALFF